MKTTRIALILMSVLFTNKLLAQDVIEEIIVTSSFIEQNLDQIHNPIHVIGSDELASMASQSLGESLDDLLGVGTSDYGSAVGHPIIRGLGGTRVKVMRNGRLNRDVSGLGADHPVEIDFNNIQQIEVVRGPSSLFYANGTSGGIINIVDNTIARKDFTESDLTLGYEVQSVNNGNIGELSYENNFGGLNFSLGYRDTDFENFEIPYGAIIHEEHEEEKSYQDLTNTMISWKNRILIDNKSEIEFTLGFSSNKRKEFGHHEEEGHDDHDDDDHDDDDHDDHDEHGEGPALNMELETTTFDFKYIFPKSEKLELIIGANMLSQTNTNLAHEELIPNAEKNDLGVFALSHIHTSKWDILLGLRIDNRKIETSDFDQNYNSFTSSVGFKRDFAENKFFRFNISNGYRAPNLSELFSEGLHHGTNLYEIGDSTLSEEKNIQTDISLSSYGSDSSFGLDVFYNSINDYIYLNPTNHD